jgi:hypothetical protein
METIPTAVAFSPAMYLHLALVLVDTDEQSRAGVSNQMSRSLKR